MSHGFLITQYAKTINPYPEHPTEPIHLNKLSLTSKASTIISPPKYIEPKKKHHKSKRKKRLILLRYQTSQPQLLYNPKTTKPKPATALSIVTPRHAMMSTSKSQSIFGLLSQTTTNLTNSVSNLYEFRRKLWEHKRLSIHTENENRNIKEKLATYDKLYKIEYFLLI